MKYPYEVVVVNLIVVYLEVKVSNISLLLWGIIDFFFVYKITPSIRGPPSYQFDFKKLVRRRKYE